MCGIAGEFIPSAGRRLVPTELFGMLDCIAHRGPESSAYWHDEGQSVVLMHARLAFVDLEGGTQPLSNEDGSIWVSYNGELYGYKRELRNLARRNHQLATHCDAEILPHAFEETGARSFEQLRGEFAFALYCTHSRELFLVRDRFGVKPLFYAVTDDSIIFGSEAKALFCHPRLIPKLDRGHLRQSMLGLPLPDHSLFEGVRQVRPGHFVCMSREGVVERPYWEMQTSPDQRHGSMEGAVEELRMHLDDAVRARLEAEVEVGAYLSGGIDSSAVVESMTRQSSKPVQTFTVRFSDSASDEADTAAETSARLGAVNHVIDLSGAQLAEQFTSSVWHAESFFVNSVPTAKMLLSHASRTRVKAVLTGEGSDEMFAGYELFMHQHLIEEKRAGHDVSARIRSLADPRTTGRAISGHVDYLDYEKNITRFGAYPYQLLRATITDRVLTRMLDADFARAHPLDSCMDRFASALPTNGLHGTDNLQASRICHLAMYMPSFVVSTMGDRSEMAGSIEGRVPFLDKNLADWALRLPMEMLCNGNNGKLILRQALSGRVPEAVTASGKQQFWAPPSHDDAVLLSAYNQHLLSRDTTRKVGIFNTERVALARHFIRVVPGSTRFGFMLRRFLIYAASIHALHELFVQHFDDSRRAFNTPYRQWNRRQLAAQPPQRVRQEKEIFLG